MFGSIAIRLRVVIFERPDDCRLSSSNKLARLTRVGLWLYLPSVDLLRVIYDTAGRTIATKFKLSRRSLSCTSLLSPSNGSKKLNNFSFCRRVHVGRAPGPPPLRGRLLGHRWLARMRTAIAFWRLFFKKIWKTHWLFILSMEKSWKFLERRLFKWIWKRFNKL